MNSPEMYTKLKKPKKPTVDARLKALESGVQTILDLQRQAIQRNIEIVPRFPKNHGTLWHADEIRALRHYFYDKKGYRPKQSLKEIADKFERTELAIFWKAQDLGLISEDNASFLWRGK